MVGLSTAVLLALFLPGLLFGYAFAESIPSSEAQIVPFQYYSGGGYGCTDPVTGLYIC